MAPKGKLGIIGGMGSVAAAYFFKRVVELTPATTDQEYIETFVHNNTAIPDRTTGILYGGPTPVTELHRSVKVLNEMGADYIVIACMTSHYFIPELQKNSKAIIIDGIEETVKYVALNLPGVKSVGILASTGNIKMSLFQNKFQKAGIRPIVFGDRDQETYFMEPIYKEWGIKAGYVTGKPRERFLEGAHLLIHSGADAIVGGCSEIPLVIKPDDLKVPLIDSIDILISSAIGRCLGREMSLTTARVQD